MNRLVEAITRLFSPTKVPHYVADYQRHVRTLLKSHSLADAMALAVGGEYERVGAIEADILITAGLTEKHSILDIGCGSGRLSTELGRRYPALVYSGLDVVPDLLRYAATKAPDHFQFFLNRQLSIPLPDSSCDFVAAFSVFTHLLHEESFAYLRDIARVLKPGGVAVFSVLEIGQHWRLFDELSRAPAIRQRPHATVFVEKAVVELWSKHLNFDLLRYDPSSPLGQSVFQLRKGSVGKPFFPSPTSPDSSP